MCPPRPGRPCRGLPYPDPVLRSCRHLWRDPDRRSRRRPARAPRQTALPATSGLRPRWRPRYRVPAPTLRSRRTRRPQGALPPDSAPLPKRVTTASRWLPGWSATSSTRAAPAVPGWKNASWCGWRSTAEAACEPIRSIPVVAIGSLPTPSSTCCGAPIPFPRRRRPWSTTLSRSPCPSSSGSIRRADTNSAARIRAHSRDKAGELRTVPRVGETPAQAALSTILRLGSVPPRRQMKPSTRKWCMLIAAIITSALSTPPRPRAMKPRGAAWNSR